MQRTRTPLVQVQHTKNAALPSFLAAKTHFANKGRFNAYDC